MVAGVGGSEPGRNGGEGVCRAGGGGGGWWLAAGLGGGDEEVEDMEAPLAWRVVCDPPFLEQVGDHGAAAQGGRENHAESRVQEVRRVGGAGRQTGWRGAGGEPSVAARSRRGAHPLRALESCKVQIFISLPKRDELRLRTVAAQPKASSTGLAASMDDARSAASWREWWARYLQRAVVV